MHRGLWNAAQRELVTSDTMHNATRMLRGTHAIPWASCYAGALIRLDSQYSLDGQDPSSIAGIQ